VVRNDANRPSEVPNRPERLEEVSPLLMGAMIAFLPALLCWAGIIEVILKTSR
jgi:hypothetical protein